MTEAPTTRQLTQDAWVSATVAAEASGLVVREVVEPAGHREIERLFSGVWSSDGMPSPISGDVMRVLSYSGSYVAGAYADNRLLGAAAGFLTNGLPGSDVTHLHSHIAGVAPDSRGRNVGFALKLHQRAWALDRGYDRITWTFDPLVRRNAYFNLGKLGAAVIGYLLDFYGDMQDGLNAGQGSDRLMVEWLLESAAVAQAAQRHPAVPDPRLRAWVRRSVRCGTEQEPVIGGGSRVGSFACAIPADIEEIRRTDPTLARAWRDAVRTCLRSAMAGGAVVAGFDKELGYLLRSDSPGSP